MRHFSWSFGKWPGKKWLYFTNHCKNTRYLFLQKLHVISHLHDQQHHQDCQIVHDGGCSHCQRCKAQPSAFTQWGQINHCYIARPALLDHVAGLYVVELYRRTIVQINHCYIARRALLDYVARLYCRTIVYVDQALLHCKTALQDFKPSIVTL